MTYGKHTIGIEIGPNLVFDIITKEYSKMDRDCIPNCTCDRYHDDDCDYYCSVISSSGIANSYGLITNVFELGIWEKIIWLRKYVIIVR